MTTPAEPIRAAAEELGRKIAQLLRDFEHSTGATVGRIEPIRARSVSERGPGEVVHVQIASEIL